MSPAAIEKALVAALRRVPAGEKGVTAELRAAIGCTAAELKAAIEKLRMQGKLIWGRLELAPSMRDDAPASEAAPAAQEQDPDEAPLADAEPECSGTGPEVETAADPPPPRDEGEAAAADESGSASADAGGGGEATPPPPSSADVPPSGAQLHAEVLAYLERTRTPKSRFLDRLGGNNRLLALQRTARPRPATVENIRRLMIDHPHGLPVRALHPIVAVQAEEMRKAEPPAAAMDEAPAPASSHYSALSPDELAAEIRGYLDRTGMAKSRFGALASNDPKLLERLSTAVRIRARTVHKLREWMASHPDGDRPEERAPKAHTRPVPKGEIERGATRHAREVVAVEAPPPGARIADQVRHEAEVIGARRRLASSISSGAQMLSVAGPLTIAEQIQTEIADEPGDLMRAINRRHPLLWRRVLELGRRDRDKMPSLALYRALEAGLDQLEREGAPS